MNLAEAWVLCRALDAAADHATARAGVLPPVARCPDCGMTLRPDGAHLDYRAKRYVACGVRWDENVNETTS